MRILRARHLGFCFGVRDAIALAHQQARHGPFTLLGELVHNPSVRADLLAHGVGMEANPEAILTSTVMVTAHGASESLRTQLHQRGFAVLDATCPLVRYAHRKLAALVAAGFHPVIVGLRGHAEVRGLTEDLPGCDIILRPEDVESLAAHPRFGVISQTTQPVARSRRLAGLIQQRFPAAEVRWVDTVCQPTKQRQDAAAELARQCSVVVVLGGTASNNTRELLATCGLSCARVHLVQTARDLRPAWFHAEDCVGITAGTSTPDDIVEQVADWLETLAGASQLAPRRAFEEAMA